MDQQMLMNIMMNQMMDDTIKRFKRKARKIKKQIRIAKGRNTRSVKKKIYDKMGLEAPKYRRMSLLEKSLYNYARQFNSLPKCIRDTIQP